MAAEIINSLEITESDLRICLKEWYLEDTDTDESQAETYSREAAFYMFMKLYQIKFKKPETI